MMQLVFVVDSVIERRSIIKHALEQAGYRVETFATTRMLEMAENTGPSLVISATELPDGTGAGLRKRIRQSPALTALPVILISDSRTSSPSAAIDADLSFPFAAEDLVEVVKNVLQSGADNPSSSPPAEIVIDSSAMKIFVDGRQIVTTNLEFRLLDYMARHQGKVFTRDALLDAVWGDLRFVTPRSVDACIRRIRRKMEPESNAPKFLKTIRGIGYKLDARSDWEGVEESCDCRICTAMRMPKPVSGGSAASAGRLASRAGGFR